MLACCCFREGISLARLARWRFVDTLHVLRAIGCRGACLKLQCQKSSRRLDVGPAAHRAKDDAEALLAVMDSVAASLGTTAPRLLALFAASLDSVATEVSLAWACLL